MFYWFLEKRPVAPREVGTLIDGAAWCYGTEKVCKEEIPKNTLFVFDGI